MFAPFQKKKKNHPGEGVGKSAPSTHTRNEDSRPLLLRDQKCGSAGDSSLPGPWRGAPPVGIATAGLPRSEGPIPTAARRGRPRARVLPRKRSPGEERSGQPLVLVAHPRPAPQPRPPQYPSHVQNSDGEIAMGALRTWSLGGSKRVKCTGCLFPPQRVEDLGSVCLFV